MRPQREYFGTNGITGIFRQSGKELTISGYLTKTEDWDIFRVVASARFKRLPSGRIQYHGETFAGFNKPKAAPQGSKKKFVVLGKEGDKIKKVSYGHRDYQDFRQHKDPKRRANFRSRHNCQTAKDKTTARYWACKHLW